MPLTVVKNKETKKNEVVLVADKKPFIMSSRVPAQPRMEHEMDYDMHRIQAALVPPRTRLRSGT